MQVLPLDKGERERSELGLAVAELRRRRLERGWTLDEAVDELHRLAGRLGEPVPGVDRQAVSRWERGVHRPRPHYVRLLSALYEASPRELGLIDADREFCLTHPSDAGSSDDVERRSFLMGAVGMLALGNVGAAQAGRLAGWGWRQSELHRVRAEVDRAVRLSRASQFSVLNVILPGVLDDAARLADAASDREKQFALGQLSRAHAAAAWVATKSERPVEAQVAAERAIAAAREGDAPVLLAAAIRCLAEVHLRQKRYSISRDLAVEAANQIERRGVRSDPAVAVRGGSYLSAAIAAARAGDQQGTTELLSIARDIGDGLGRDVTEEAVFGPSNVVIHQVATAVELGNLRRALGVASHFRFDRQEGFEERGARHLIDVARAHAALGAPSEAVEALIAAEHTAPEETRGHRLTRDVLRQLVSHPGRAGLPRIRSLMQRCGVQ